jgi:L-fuculose-phosphate aldolase
MTPSATSSFADAVAGDQHAEARAALAAACHRLAAEGLVPGTAGNASVLVGEDRIVVSPTGAVLAEVDAAHAAVVDRAGALLDGPLAATSELPLHLAAYELGAGAVVHAHAPFATALACVLDEVPLVHYAMLAFGGTVRVATYATFGTPELAAGVRAALTGRRAALMANHGAVTIGPDLQTAVELMVELEWVCAVYWRAAQLGPPRLLSEADLAAVAGEIDRRGYGRPQPAGA